MKKKMAIALGLMILGSVGLDQVSKVHSQDRLMVWSHDTDVNQYQGRRYRIFSHGLPVSDRKGELYLALNMNYVRNTGAAWGALSDLPDNFRVPFFYLVTAVAVVIIISFMRQTPVHHRFAHCALALILSGAIGNFIDRVLYGFVIDWIDVRWRILGWRYDFPNFNIADSAITVGVGMLIFDMLVLERARHRKTEAEGAATTA